MSYFRKRNRRGLSGIQSQPPGGRVLVSALSGDAGAPRWYRQMQGCSLLGDDEPTASSLLEPTLADPFQRQMLAATTGIRAIEAERLRAERIRGALQIVATLSIPLAAAVWRLVLKRRTSSTPA